MTAQKVVIPPSREVDPSSFVAAVRNNLSKVANCLGFDRWDRDELVDLAESDRVHRHWKNLLTEVGSRDIPEHVWNTHVRAATRECVAYWGQV